jgi:hypothetical protein
MLMVICGAGASYDSVLPEELANISSMSQRPPLAKDLFEGRPEFTRLLQLFQCDDLAVHLRGAIRNSGGDLETELEKLTQQAEGNERLQRELIGLLFYLQGIMWQCSQWGNDQGILTNHRALLRQIDLHRGDEQVCIVTFNYDTLIENALTRYKDEPLESLDSYVTGAYKLFKLHGSVDWGLRVREDYGSSFFGDELRQKMIQRGSHLPVSDIYVKLAEPSPRTENGRPLLPAISVPVLGKTEKSFRCPEEHLAMLGACLKELRKILVIGWRGSEEHFLGLLTRPNPPEYPQVMIVSDSNASAEETADALRSRDLCISPQKVTTGFSGLIGSEELENFLAI